MRRKKKNRRLKPCFKIIFGIIIFILCIIFGFFIYNKYFGNNVDIDKNSEKDNEQDNSVVDKIKEESYEASLIAVGDNLIHSSVFKVDYLTIK